MHIVNWMNVAFIVLYENMKVFIKLKLGQLSLERVAEWGSSFVFHSMSMRLKVVWRLQWPWVLSELHHHSARAEEVFKAVLVIVLGVLVRKYFWKCAGYFCQDIIHSSLLTLKQCNAEQNTGKTL